MGRLPDELANAPACPAELGHVWRWFAELNARRPRGEGDHPISYAEIDAWARLSGIQARPFEVAALLAVDNAFLSANEKPRGKNGN